MPTKKKSADGETPAAPAAKKAPRSKKTAAAKQAVPEAKAAASKKAPRSRKAPAKLKPAPVEMPVEVTVEIPAETPVEAAPVTAPAVPSEPPAATPESLDGALARVAELEARLERGLRFVHVVIDRNQRAIEAHAALLHGLGDASVRRAGVLAEEVAAARDAYLRSAPPPAFRVRVAPDVDKYAVPAAEVDCAARLHLCKAACCRKPFALGTQDLEEGVLKWDWADPYVNRRDAEGDCVHHGLDVGCTVYAQRPLRCRRYDCRDDASVWIDFDRAIPHPDLAALPTPTMPSTGEV